MQKWSNQKKLLNLFSQALAALSWSFNLPFSNIASTLASCVFDLLIVWTVLFGPPTFEPGQCRREAKAAYTTFQLCSAKTKFLVLSTCGGGAQGFQLCSKCPAPPWQFKEFPAYQRHTEIFDNRQNFSLLVHTPFSAINVMSVFFAFTEAH